jgi:hypothetical protein
MIRCLGCRETFGNLVEYKRHEARRDHPDAGEVYC